MNIYFAGIGGVGIGPLASIALDMGYSVSGSDLEESVITKQLLKRKNINISFDQTGQNLAKMHQKNSIDWFIYTSALPDNHPELLLAKKLNIKTSKRDQFLSFLIKKHQLKLVAIAGTHGKTTTTGMVIWGLKQLNIPASYAIGTTINFGASGKFDPKSDYFIYECDEFDKNFLHFKPWASGITALSYDHPDTYPTKQQYYAAFGKFINQSNETFIWQKDLALLDEDKINRRLEVFSQNQNLNQFNLSGDYLRQNAFIAQKLINKVAEDLNLAITEQQITDVINSFVGTNRRFEKITHNIYSDYAHHPTEITATLQRAKELNDNVVIVYQPHQNSRQHQIKDLYTDAVFENAQEIYWLPTYLAREDPNLEILTAKQLTAQISTEKVKICQLDDNLRQTMQKLSQNNLIICMGAGSIDKWVRDNFAK